MSICAHCEVLACSTRETLPPGCPMRSGQWLDRAREAYMDEDNRRIAQVAAHVEKTGYCEWTRLQEIKEFCQASGFGRLGLASCAGLKREAKIAADYYREHGLEVISVLCCSGGMDKDCAGIAPEDRFRSEGFEAMCNSIGQAELLNEKGTDFNVVLGLCVGHDSLFFKYSKAPTTVLAAKDRRLAHNPLAAIYLEQSYYRHIHNNE